MECAGTVTRAICLSHSRVAYARVDPSSYVLYPRTMTNSPGMAYLSPFRYGSIEAR